VSTPIAALGAALWLGVVTSISPCPLATNVVAISFVGNRVGKAAGVMASGLLYTLGRVLAYGFLGVLLVSSLLSVPDVAQFLDRTMNHLLGPVLIASGVALVLSSRLRLGGSGMSERLKGRVEKAGVWGALALGFLFALSFCPVSAALFFGSLVPLALEHQSRIAMPALYGIGTAVPVLAFTVLLATGSPWLGKSYAGLAKAEPRIRGATAAIFMLVGTRYTLIYNFGVEM
jgi:cytochrome c-type biogenesis protein